MYGPDNALFRGAIIINMKVLLVLVFIFCFSSVSWGQNPVSQNNSYAEGDTATQILRFNVGKIVISGIVKLRIAFIPDADSGKTDQDLRVGLEVHLDKKTKAKLPQRLIENLEGEAYVTMTNAQFDAKVFPFDSVRYWFEVLDFNLDGVPDLAAIGDLGFHSSPVNYYVWVNLNGQFVYWDRISDRPSYPVGTSKNRIINLGPKGNIGRLTFKKYRILKDTVLVPLQ